MTNRCYAELCRDWTGQGCFCELMDLEPDVVREPGETDEHVSPPGDEDHRQHHPRR